MSLISYELFIGRPVTPALTAALAQANPHLVNLLINAESPDYLQLIAQENELFLGKFVGQPFSADQIGQTRQHIDSLFHRLVTSELTPLQLLPASREHLTSWSAS